MNNGLAYNIPVINMSVKMFDGEVPRSYLPLAVTMAERAVKF